MTNDPVWCLSLTTGTEVGCVGSILLYISSFSSFSSMNLLLISLTGLAHFHCEALIRICLFFQNIVYIFLSSFSCVFPATRLPLPQFSFGYHFQQENQACAQHASPGPCVSSTTAPGALIGLLVTSLGHSSNTKPLEGRCHIDFYASLYLQYPAQHLPTVQQLFVKGIDEAGGCGWLWALGYEQEIDCSF